MVIFMCSILSFRCDYIDCKSLKCPESPCNQALCAPSIKPAIGHPFYHHHHHFSAQSQLAPGPPAQHKGSCEHQQLHHNHHHHHHHHHQQQHAKQHLLDHCPAASSMNSMCQDQGTRDADSSRSTCSPACASPSSSTSGEF